MNKYTVITENGTQIIVRGNEILETTFANSPFFLIVYYDKEGEKIEVLRTPITSTIATQEMRTSDAAN